MDEQPQATAVATLPEPAAGARPATPRKLLHVGCGVERLAGWVNVDYQLFPTVDVVADMRDDLPFRGVEAVFAEHFLEHLTLASGLSFLESAHEALADGGWLRLTTPNLEWVWFTQYKLGLPPEEARTQALLLNRGFYGWGHRFLWNLPLLEEAVHCCGFDGVTVRERGDSAAPFLAGLERHEPYPDFGTMSHVVVVEARKGPRRPEEMARLRQRVWDLFWSHQELGDRGPIGHDGVRVPRQTPGAAGGVSLLRRIARHARRRWREIHESD